MCVGLAAEDRDVVIRFRSSGGNRVSYFGFQWNFHGRDACAEDGSLEGSVRHVVDDNRGPDLSVLSGITVVERFSFSCWKLVG